MKYLLILSLVFQSLLCFGAEASNSSIESKFGEMDKQNYVMGNLEVGACLIGGWFVAKKEYSKGFFFIGLAIGIGMSKIYQTPELRDGIRESANTVLDYSRNTLLPAVYLSLANNFWYLSFFTLNVAAYFSIKHNLNLLRFEDKMKLLKCPVCWDSLINIALSCGHTVCDTCLPKLENCAVCRAAILSSQKLFLPGEDS